ALPAWSMSGLTYSRANAGLRGPGASSRRLRESVVVLQVAIAQILLVGAGLLIGTLSHLMAVDTGFQMESRLAFRISLPAAVYSNSAAQGAFFAHLLERLAAIPGVTGAGISTLTPFDVRNDTATFHIEGYEELPGTKPLGSELRLISGGYPAAIGMPLVAGR